MFDYRDFELEIGALDGATYPLAVRSPAGETRQALTLPFTPAELAGWRRRLEAAIVSGAAGTRGVRLLSTSPADEAPSAQAFGANLFTAVFAGNVLSLYDASHALARQAGAGLRLRLRILAPELAALPWELLYDLRSGEYLCLSAQTPLVRAVETMQPLQTLAVEPPLRILGMAVAPADLPPLNVARAAAPVRSPRHGGAGADLDRWARLARPAGQPAAGTVAHLSFHRPRHIRCGYGRGRPGLCRRSGPRRPAQHPGDRPAAGRPSVAAAGGAERLRGRADGNAGALHQHRRDAGAPRAAGGAGHAVRDRRRGRGGVCAQFLRRAGQRAARGRGMRRGAQGHEPGCT